MKSFLECGYQKGAPMTKRSKKPFDKINFSLEEISPITPSQKKAFESTKNLVLHGAAGTGKTFIGMYLGFEAVSNGLANQLLLVRSAVPTRDIGYLPGSEQEKAKVYEAAYSQICSELFNRGDAYQNLKDKGIVKFMTTSFIRAITIQDCIIVVDECQNMTMHELDSIITRVGPNCRIIFSGDFLQSDLESKKEKSGLKTFMHILRNMESFDTVEFSIEDIVRSGLVKEYLTAKYKSLI
jgi:phosphate starvation-inducible PhoH-like protein